MPRAELLDRVAGKAGLLAMLTDRVDAELLDRAGPELAVVANYAVGFDNLDLDACTARGVLATNTPDVVTEATADLTWALLLAAARRVAEGDRFLRSRRPWIWGPDFFLGSRSRQDLGVVGLGRIGGRWSGGPPGSGCQSSTTARHRLPPEQSRPRRRLARARPAAGRGRLRQHPHRPVRGDPPPERCRELARAADGRPGQHGGARLWTRAALAAARPPASWGGRPDVFERDPRSTRPARPGTSRHRPPPGHRDVEERWRWA